MLSFIVIGYNEGWKLTKCIQSIVDAIKYNQLEDYEIIYVDSQSKDNSIERVNIFNQVKVIRLLGNINAAIARNAGVKQSKGDVLFFIDGDMEIEPKFLQLVYSKNDGLINNFVSGHWINFYYNHRDELIKNDNIEERDQDRIEKTTGGLFLIDKSSWELVGGMKEIFKISEDIDLGLRLAKENIFLLRKKEIVAFHHTIDYFDKKRMWQDFFKWNHLYGRSLLYRTHIFNKHIYARIIRNDYTLVLLIFSILFSIIWIKFALIAIPFYFLVILLRSKFNPEKGLYYFLRDLSVFIGFIVFFPKRNVFSVEKYF